MSYNLEQRNLNNYLESFQSTLQRRTGINLFEPDSIANNLINVFSEQLLNERQEVIRAIDNSELTKARGKDLVRIGESRGVKKIVERYAYALATDNKVAFYVESGTFGDLNSGSSIVIPIGTKIWSSRAENDLGREIIYQVTEETTLGLGSSLGYVSVKAMGSGSDFNVGTSVLQQHNFVDYVAGSGLKVINFAPILNGTNPETDDDYRYRISQQYTNIATVNQTNAKLQAINIPGVLDTKIIEGYYGIGSVALVVLGAEFKSSSDMIASVQTKLNQFKLPGVKIIAIPAVNTLFDIYLTIRLNKEITSSDKDRLENNIKSICISYLRSIGLGGEVSLQELGKIISRFLPKVCLLRSDEIGVFSKVILKRGFVESLATEQYQLSGTSVSLEQTDFADLYNITISYE